MKTAQSSQKRYADKRRRELEFAVGDHVFVKIAPMKSVMRFDENAKLSPRFKGSFDFLKKIGTLAYRVALPPMLLTPNMSYKERPTQILDRQERRLRNKVIHMVKVKWINHSEEEATWKTETDMRSSYPELLDKS
ncbi:uncharacterized protein [Primulina huaijiensis]|uniref:uncharacterized protein n=1 Tax=Primulina huaijiensis TaxID=1492673 RepID=UPI003CC78D46